jgi:histidine triad (HIT) family protein
MVCEADAWVAFFPREPVTPGHTLVIPRSHVPDLWALEPGLASELIQAVISVGRAIRVAVKPEGMNLITSAGAAAEQTVLHVHLHLVPRWPQDGLGRIWPPDTHMGERLQAEAAERIRQECRGG